jgi:hypothetical protein
MSYEQKLEFGSATYAAALCIQITEELPNGSTDAPHMWKGTARCAIPCR